MKLLVVILNYRVTDLTIDCLRSLEPEVSSTPGFRVAVLENGTGGDAFVRLKRAVDENGWGAWVAVTEIHPNRGFTGGNNVVIREALASDDPPEYFVLLNADTVVEADALGALVRQMDTTPRAGIGGSLLLSPEGVVQASPFRFAGVATEFNRGMRLGMISRLLKPWGIVPPTPKEPSSVEWVSGASMILRKSMLDEIGLLDEGLYTYFDDIDICLRARRAGWETWFVPGSRVVHLEGASTGIVQRVVKRRPDYWFAARRRFFLKSYGPMYTALVDAAYLVGFAAWRLRRRVQGKPDTDPPHMLADSLRHSVFVAGFSPTEVENPAMKQDKAT
ncbi:MAG: glycosyltransferase family 2 protein [Anaeromyxobacteraceae bacterium]